MIYYDFKHNISNIIRTGIKRHRIDWSALKYFRLTLLNTSQLVALDISKHTSRVFDKVRFECENQISALLYKAFDNLAITAYR